VKRQERSTFYCGGQVDFIFQSIRADTGYDTGPLSLRGEPVMIRAGRWPEISPVGVGTGKREVGEHKAAH